MAQQLAASSSSLSAGSPGHTAQYAGARAAFLELQSRLNSDYSDPQLKADLGEALTLMGHPDLAATFLENVERLDPPIAALGSMGNFVQPETLP